MATTRQVIEVNPVRSGLATAGKQGVIQETQLWQAKNISVGLDGGLMKRPGLRKWGQTLKVASGEMIFSPLFFDNEILTEYKPSDYVTANNQNGLWRVSVDANSGAAETATYGKALTEPSGWSTSTWGVRWVHRVTDWQSGQWYQVGARAQTTDDMYAVRIYDDGVYLYDGSDWLVCHAVNFPDVGPSSIEIVYDGSNLAVYVNDELVCTDSAPSAVTADDSSTHIEFTFSADYDDPATLYFSDVLMGTGDEPFTESTARDGIDYELFAEDLTRRRRLILATDSRLYVDYDLRNVWTPVLDLDQESIYLTKFSDKIIVFDSGKVYAWDTTEAPTLLEDAPPVRFGGEYKRRLFAAGNPRHPRRIYFTALNQEEVWFSPEDDVTGEETVDEVLDAGFIAVPGQDGSIVTAVYGDFYGTCIFTTFTGIGRINGSSPLSFTLEYVSSSDGAAGPRCLARVGNDLWIVGQRGVTTLQTVMEFGDIQTKQPSATIADMWSSFPNSPIRVDLNRLSEASLTWSPTESLVYFCFRPVGRSGVDTVYVFSVLNGSWYGPWTCDSTFVRTVVIDSPTTYVVMHGTTGKVGTTSAYLKSDYGNPYTATVESALMSGRSLGQQLNSHPKRWRRLHLHIAPMGAWDLNIEWYVDNETSETITETQNQYDSPVLSDDFRLDVDRLGSRQLVSIIPVKLDMRGHYFKFSVSTADDEDNEDFVLHGYEVEFLVDSDEEIG
jgi:hypothetical protein